MNKKKIIGIFLACVLFCTTGMFPVATVDAAGNKSDKKIVKIDEKHFPDAVFRAYVKASSHDKNQNG